MYNRTRVGENFECVVYKRIPNTNEYEKTNTKFTARVMTNYEIRQAEKITGLLGMEVSTMLYSTTLDKMLKQNDKVLFDGKLMLVEACKLNLNNTPYTLGNSRFSRKYSEKKFPKFISLK